MHGGTPNAAVDVMEGHSRELIETRLEYRDGGVWLAGLCPGCWEHVAVLAPPSGPPMTLTCPNGHELRVRDFRSEGLPLH